MIPVKIKGKIQTDEEKPLVSIVCITYNHVKYIAQAIEGFLMQETTFKVEILIHDDASMDGTANIVREYEKRYPDLIKAIYRSKNQYSRGNNPSLYLIGISQGKYVAFCEGDDYWTDPMKLQKQVDILEVNNEIALVFHPVKFLHSDGQITPDTIIKIPSTITNLSTLALKGNYIHTPTVVFRNTNIIWNTIFNKSPIGDYIFYNIIMESGYAYCIEDEMAIYRYGTGSWSSQTQHFRDFGTTIAFLCLYTYFQNKDVLIANIYKKRIEKSIRELFVFPLRHVTHRDLMKLERISPEASKLVREIVPLRQQLQIIKRDGSNFIVKCMQLLRLSLT